jgi:hypothetical protein
LTDIQEIRVINYETAQDEEINFEWNGNISKTEVEELTSHFTNRKNYTRVQKNYD